MPTDDLEAEPTDVEDKVSVDHFGDLSETNGTSSTVILNTLDDPLGKSPEIGEWSGSKHTIRLLIWSLL